MEHAHELYTTSAPPRWNKPSSLPLLARHDERVADHGVEIARHVAYRLAERGEATRP